eukprot:gene16076-biopygen12781
MSFESYRVWGAPGPRQLPFLPLRGGTVHWRGRGTGLPCSPLDRPPGQGEEGSNGRAIYYFPADLAPPFALDCSHPVCMYTYGTSGGHTKHLGWGQGGMDPSAELESGQQTFKIPLELNGFTFPWTAQNITLCPPPRVQVLLGDSSGTQRDGISTFLCVPGEGGNRLVKQCI